MSLTAKIGTALAALTVCVAAAAGLLHNRAMSGLQSDLEDREVERQLHSIERAIDAEIDEVARTARRFAASGPVTEIARGTGTARDGQSTATETLVAEDIDLFCVLGMEGELLDGACFDADGNATTALPAFIRDGLHPTHSLAAAGEGLLVTERGPFLLASRAVTSDTGSPHGFAVVGRLLDQEVSERISMRSGALFASWQLGDHTTVPAELEDVVAAAQKSGAAVTRSVAPHDGPSSTAIYTTLDDIEGRAGLFISTAANEPKLTGSGALLKSSATTLVLAVLLLIGALIAVDRILLRPLRALATYAATISESDETPSAPSPVGDDEFGSVTTEFERLAIRLNRAESTLVETARTAGLSEIATGILHNVGNVLNSVNISASLVSQRVDGLCIDDLERLSEVLEEHQDDLPRFLAEDPRGQHIQPFLSALVVQLGEEQKTIRGEVSSLADGIDHICELIKSQQNLAKGTRAIEPTNLVERMNEALRITQRVQGVDPELVVVRRFDDLPDVRLDKHKLLEILVNLLQNARQAMVPVSGTRELTLEVKAIDDEQIRIAVGDSGVGIETDDIGRVFSMGFTTREEGHGFGLHSSANAAKEMGGTLRAESDGPGRGARFVLDLPLAPPGELTESTETTRTKGGAA